MNKLSKSAVVLIILAVAAVVLGLVLFLNMPETWTESFGPGNYLENGASHHLMHDGVRERFGSTGRGGSRHVGQGFLFGFILIAGLLIFLITGRRGHEVRRNHSLAILDQMYAEEKISVEEYRRKKAVIEEEN